MFKRQKWQRLTLGAGFDRHTIPIFRASCGGNRTTPLLKTLMSSYCQNDCKFCPFRSERRINRDRWEPLELARTAIKLRKMKKIQGVFLSSSVEKDPDRTTERIIQSVEYMRKMGFQDYVHTKIMPGASRELIKKAAEISDRIGINIEFPNQSHYEDMKLFLKYKQDVIRRIRWLSEEVKKLQKQGKCKAGLDTQMVVGASDETDKEIIKISGWVYQKLNARRAYYSRFDPIKNTPMEDKPSENPWREYRLYQSSFLLRDYGFKSKEFVFDDDNMLNLKQDPKFSIAKQNDLTLDINDGKFEELIRVPGIGLKTAQKIIENRPVKNIPSLKKLGVIVKRAVPFIEVNGIRQFKLSKWLN